MSEKLQNWFIEKLIIGLMFTNNTATFTRNKIISFRLKMKYNNETVRRQNRLLDEQDAKAILRNGEYGFLSMNGEKGGYGIPISYVWDGEGVIYFHCAREGEKLNRLAVNPIVSFCVVGRTNVIYDKFTTEYESVLAKGCIHSDLSDEERKKGLILLLQKYSPDDVDLGIEYMEKSFQRTLVLRLDIEEFSGKARQ